MVRVQAWQRGPRQSGREITICFRVGFPSKLDFGTPLTPLGHSHCDL